MPLGLGSNLSRAISKPITPGIVTDNLVLKHKYDAGSVVPISDGAAKFVKSDTDYILLSDTMQSTFRGDWSVSMWIKPVDAANSSLQALMGSKNSTEEDWWYVGIDDGDLVAYYRANDDADNVRSDGQVLSSGVEGWHHVAFTVKKFTATTGWLVYLNGAEVRRDSTQSTTAENWEAFTTTVVPMIGCQNNNGSASNVFDGYMANIAVYGEQLTQAKVKSIMNKNYAGLTDSDKTNLVSWWNLDSSIAPNYDGSGTSGSELAEPSAMTGLILDNHDETLTEVSLTNSDFTSGSGTTITDWTNSDSNKWEISGDTIISPNGVSLLRRNDNPTTNGVAHKLIVRAKNTVPGSTARLQVYFGGNNHARYDLTDDFQEYTFQGIQQNDTTFILYNPSGGDSTNVTVDWVKLYKYDGNVGVLV